MADTKNVRSTQDKIVARNLRLLKALAKVTDADIAAATGISRSTVNNKLNGATRCSLVEAAQFADYFGVTIDQLLSHPARLVAAVTGHDDAESGPDPAR